MFTVYVLKMSNQKFYIGRTNDLDARLVRHNSGQVTSTRRHRPIELVYSEDCESRFESVRRERQLKSWKSHVAIEKLIAKNTASSSNG